MSKQMTLNPAEEVKKKLAAPKVEPKSKTESTFLPAGIKEESKKTASQSSLALGNAVGDSEEVEEEELEMTSAQVDSSCQTCGLIGPCIHHITLTAEEDEDAMLEYPDTKVVPVAVKGGSPIGLGAAHLALIDEGNGVSTKLLVESKCARSSNCPESILHIYNPYKASWKKTQPFLTGTGEKKITFFWDKNKTPKIEAIFAPNEKEDGAKTEAENLSEEKEESFWKFIADTVFSFFCNSGLPRSGLFDAHKHKVEVLGHGKQNDVTLHVDVYPSVECMGAVVIEEEYKNSVRTDTERQEEWKKKKSEAFRNIQDQLTPKQKAHQLTELNRHPIRGWAANTDDLSKAKETTVGLKVSLKVQGVEYALKLDELTKRKKTKTRNSRSASRNRFSGLADLIQNNLFSAQEGRHGRLVTRNYPVFSIEREAMKAVVGYTYTHKPSIGDPKVEHAISISADPLIGFYFKIDLLQAIANYCRVGSIVGKVRAYLKKRKEEGKSGGELNCYLACTASASLEIKWIIAPQQTFKVLDDSKMALSFIGHVDVQIKVNVVFIEGFLEATGELKTTGYLGVDNHNDGLDLALYHDGLKVFLQLKVEGTLEFGSVFETAVSKEQKTEFVLAAPLKKEDSTARINLWGKCRQTAIPKNQT